MDINPHIVENYRTPPIFSPDMQYAYKFFHEGIQALTDIEETGVCIDVPLCQKHSDNTKRDIEILEKSMEKYEATKIWRKIFGNNFNIDSDPQLKTVLFGEKGLGLEPKKTTPSGQPATDQDALEKLEYDQDFVSDLIKLRKKNKLYSTYLSNILAETVDGILHPFYHLHIVRTFRSSASLINFQNTPIRDPEIGSMIRSAFLPRPGEHLVELDYSGIEVVASTWYHKDPVMLSYIADKTKDMHRDMAMQCYLLDTLDKNNKYGKKVRYSGKNAFVFPQFYGDYYVNCANNLWNNIHFLDLRCDDGTPLKKHLKDKGISNYKQFEKHIQEVEKDFWGRRFKVYGDWKEEIWKQYQKTGKIYLLNGFVCSGVMSRNDVTNYPIQGIAFHTLLWSLIEINKILKREKWITRLIGQIHDSILASVPPKELQPFLAMAREVMTQKIREAWNFIITELEVEAEYTEVDRPWSEKKNIKFDLAT